jgi:hypothetical protein
MSWSFNRALRATIRWNPEAYGGASRKVPSLPDTGTAAKVLDSNQVDNQIKLARLLDRKIPGLRPAQDLVVPALFAKWVFP